MDETVLGSFDLMDEIARFPPGARGGGRRAETLIKTGGLTVVLVTMHAGGLLREHAAPGPITIHAVRGRFAVAVGGTERTVPAGSLVGVAAGARHAVRALEDGAFLLTIAGSVRPDPGD